MKNRAKTLLLGILFAAILLLVVVGGILKVIHELNEKRMFAPPIIERIEEVEEIETVTPEPTFKTSSPSSSNSLVNFKNVRDNVRREDDDDN